MLRFLPENTSFGLLGASDAVAAKGVYWFVLFHRYFGSLVYSSNPPS